MEKIKNNLPLILVSLSSILLVIAILLLVNTNTFRFNNKTNSNDTNSDTTKEINKKEDNKENNTVEPTPSAEPTSTPVPTSVPTATPVPTVVPTPVPTATAVPKYEEQITKSEEAVINYFQGKENELKPGDEKTLSEKAKEGFVNVVDFIFYDKEIKGYTFKGLTNAAKLKIISIALAIDSKIDQYFPNYKDKIKGTYTNIKTKLVEKYLEYSQKLCDAVGEDTCNSAKENWEIMKKNFSITGELLKDLGITGTEKLKDWYENWRYK